jgi:hypothetical protein
MATPFQISKNLERDKLVAANRRLRLALETVPNNGRGSAVRRTKTQQWGQRMAELEEEQQLARAQKHEQAVGVEGLRVELQSSLQQWQRLKEAVEDTPELRVKRIVEQREAALQAELQRYGHLGGVPAAAALFERELRELEEAAAAARAGCEQAKALAPPVRARWEDEHTALRAEHEQEASGLLTALLPLRRKRANKERIQAALSWGANDAHEEQRQRSGSGPGGRRPSTEI